MNLLIKFDEHAISQKPEDIQTMRLFLQSEIQRDAARFNQMAGDLWSDHTGVVVNAHMTASILAENVKTRTCDLGMPFAFKVADMQKVGRGGPFVPHTLIVTVPEVL